MVAPDIIENIQQSYTERANPRRGYHDSYYTVIFKADSTEEAQKTKMLEIQKDLGKKNMWAYAPVKCGINTWRINYGYDSGD